MVIQSSRGRGTCLLRAVRMVVEVTPNYDSQWAAINAVAQKLGIGTAETVRKWVRQVEIDAGQRGGSTTEESAELKRLRRENAELRRANEILKAASGGSTSTAPRPSPTRAPGSALTKLQRVLPRPTCHDSISAEDRVSGHAGGIQSCVQFRSVRARSAHLPAPLLLHHRQTKKLTYEQLTGRQMATGSRVERDPTTTMRS